MEKNRLPQAPGRSQQLNVQPAFMAQVPTDIIINEDVTMSFGELGVSQNIPPACVSRESSLMDQGHTTPSHPYVIIQPAVTLVHKTNLLNPPLEMGHGLVEIGHSSVGIQTFVGQPMVDMAGQPITDMAGQHGFIQKGFVQTQAGFLPQTGIVQSQAGMVPPQVCLMQQTGIVQPPTGMMQQNGLLQPLSGMMQTQAGLIQQQNGVLQQPVLALPVQSLVCGDQVVQTLHSTGSPRQAQFSPGNSSNSSDHIAQLGQGGPGTQTQFTPGGVATVNQFNMGVYGTVSQPGSHVTVTQFTPGWIQQMHHHLNQAASAPLQPPQQEQQQPSQHVASVRPKSQIRANAPEARFKALYPPGVRLFSHKQLPQGAPAGGNTPTRYPTTPVFVPLAAQGTGRISLLRPAGSTAGENNHASHSAMEADPHGSQQLPMMHQSVDVDAPASPQAPCHILDVHVQFRGAMHSMREVLVDFVWATYSRLMVETYCVPRKPPVSQKHPDKALVRAREGESRVSLALEYLSIRGREALLIVSDYHYENFLKNFHPHMVVSQDQGCVTDMLNGFAAGKLFGDFDLLAFHPQCGLLVVGLCAVNSNSDVQYILKRLQKARSQLDKSRSVAERAVSFIGLDCHVTPILAMPNLKRTFLNKVAARDKSLHRAMATLNPLCLDELPLQFRSEWMSQQHFDLLTQWWDKVKGDASVKGQMSAQQFSLLVGSFLCPHVSHVDFDQGHPARPSEWKLPTFENQPIQETGTDKQAASSAQINLSSLALTIGNVTKSFTQYIQEYVDAYFPDFWDRTYRVPPVHFNIQKTDAVSGDERLTLLGMPMSKDTRGDEGENRVVSAIEILGLKHAAVKPIFIICDFQYNNYLNKLKETMFVKGDDRRPQRAYGQSVRAQHDCLLIHRKYGIIIVSVKAVGDNFGEWANSGSEQWMAVKRTLAKVLKQLPREEKMVQLVLSDMTSDLRFHRLIALPNLLRRDVDTAISDDPDLQQQVEAMFPGKGTSAFLCKDELCESYESIWEVLESQPQTFSRLCRWWDATMGPGEAKVLTKTLMKQIIGRYCGLLSTVEVWSIQNPRVEVRSLPEAVYETGERFSQILLTPTQVEILHLSSQLVFLTGPPGGGKTTTLILKAEQWARDQQTVVILNLHRGSKGLPLGHLLQRQLEMHMSADHADKRQKTHIADEVVTSDSTPGTTTSTGTTTSSTPPPQTTTTHIQRVDCDSGKFDPSRPGRLLEIPLGACVVVDEITRASHDVLRWLVTNCDPKHVWCAGQFQDYCPQDFDMHCLQQVLRCPPMVQRVVSQTSLDLGSTALYYAPENYLLISAPNGLATDGPRPLLIFHSAHNSASPGPLDCQSCAHQLADTLTHQLNLQPVASAEQSKRRKLGPLPVAVDTLSWRDVVMVCRNAIDCALTKTLRKRGVPMAIISNTDNPQVAVPTKDELIFTTPFAMTGLERKVVIYVPFIVPDPLSSDLEVDGEGGEHRVEGEGRQALDDLKLGQALRQLSGEDRVSLWYTASRCTAQLIIFVP